MVCVSAILTALSVPMQMLFACIPKHTTKETPAYHPCDVNRDGVVDLLDVTRAQRYFGTDDPTCDVDGSGTVDVADLIMIMNNYTE